MHTDIEHLESRQAIADLMTGWMHRDLAEWDQLLALFHPDATIAFTWFEGKFTDFVDASKQMRQSNFKSKHLIGSPVITFNGDRAISETIRNERIPPPPAEDPRVPCCKAVCRLTLVIRIAGTTPEKTPVSSAITNANTSTCQSMCT